MGIRCLRLPGRWICRVIERCPYAQIITDDNPQSVGDQPNLPVSPGWESPLPISPWTVDRSARRASKVVHWIGKGLLFSLISARVWD